MAWTDLTTFANYVGSEITADRDALTSALTAAENDIRHYCGRDFTLVDGSASSSTRYYRPDQNRCVTIHDIADDTGITITDDGGTVSAANYELEPVNLLAGDGSYRPYDTIRRILSSWNWSSTTNYPVGVATARWGWTAVPQAVVEATMIHAKDIVHLRVNRFGVAGFGDFGVVRVRDNPHVTQLLTPYRKWRTAVGIA